MLVQGVNAVTGLMLVRYMAKDDYAWFTLAASLLATLNLLGDGGVGTGLTAIGGRIHGQPGAFAQLLRQGLRLSFRLTVVGFVLAAPLFYGLYLRIGAPVGLTVTALLLAGLAAWPSVSTVMLNVANRLHSRVGVIQIGELTGALVRLGVTSVLWISGWLAMLPAFLATVFAGWAQALLVRVRSRHFLAAPSEEVSYRLEMSGFVRSLYGNHIFFCLQAQVATWIIGWLAGSSEVADLGALARLGVLFVAITAPINYLAIPAIARIRDHGQLRRRMVLGLGTATLVAACVVVLAHLLPSPFLWLLGGNYGHLTVELPLALAAQGLSMVTALAWALVLARGWVKNAWITILTTLAGFAIGAALFPLGTVAGMLKFNTVVAIPTLVFCLGVITSKLARSSQAPDSLDL
jgi:O-antigen/teichoic acid export membrane protein